MSGMMALVHRGRPDIGGGRSGLPGMRLLRNLVRTERTRLPCPDRVQ